MTAQSLEQLVSLCKRRGFIFQSGEIYGGMQGLYDYGPLGVELKNNIKKSWWSSMVYERDDIEGLDASLLTHPHILKYSGHEDTFSDPLVDCKKCKMRFRADHVKDVCPSCGASSLTQPRPFNLMFRTNVGPVSTGEHFAYLRPETAQSIFVNFKNVIDSTSRQLPFGIVQIGRAFRNEITPRNFIFRMREFEQMELEFFVEPENDEKWHEYWVELREKWWYEQGIAPERLTRFQVPSEDLSHYSKGTVDLMYAFPHGVEELEGIANRTDFDLKSHSKSSVNSDGSKNTHSCAKLNFSDPSSGKEAFVPYVIEPSAGLDRAFLAILNEAYCEETLENAKSRLVLKLKPHLAPIKATVIPLKRNNEDMVNYAKDIRQMLQKLGLGRVLMENKGNIGKSYRRNDEIGTPICITVDFDTLSENVVTVRCRDSMKQNTVSRDALVQLFRDMF